MGRKYIPKEKLYTEAGIACAINEVKNGAKIKPTAKKYFISATMLTQRISKDRDNLTVGKQGRGKWMDANIEENLAVCLRRMSEIGMSPTLIELKLILSDYLLVNEINTFNDYMPGPDWISSFLRRHKLTLRKATTMQIARRNVTSDPFVIYGYYDVLEKEIEKLGIRDRPECFWNVDESGFPTDPSRCKTIHIVGKPAIRITCGANRENTTVMASCCADGTAMDPLVIFKGKGKGVMSNWKGDGTLPNVTYGVSESGWINTDIFHTWFEHFCQETKHIRPLLLLFDGHLSHTSIQTIELAMKEGISILKLPAHCTDVLQPLDVACFNPLKNYYEIALTHRVYQTGAKEPLRKGAFCNLLGEIWKKGMSCVNVKSGFEATGIYPPNREKYRITRLDSVKLASYERWVKAGKPMNDNNEPCVPPLFNILAPGQEKLNASEDNMVESIAGPSTSGNDPSRPHHRILPLNESVTPLKLQNSSQTSLLTPNSHKLVKSLIQQIQSLAPEGMRYVVSLEPKESVTTFESVLKSRGRPCTTGPPAKRNRISMHAAIITHEDFHKEVQKKTIIGAKSKTIKMKNKPKQAQLEKIDSSSSDSELDSTDVESLPESIHSATMSETNYKSVLDTQNIKKGDYYAMYWEKTYYWCKVIEVFRDDEGLPPTKLEMSSLTRKVVSSDPSKVRWGWPINEDKVIINVDMLLVGPDKPIVDTNVKGKTWYSFTTECYADMEYTAHKPLKRRNIATNLKAAASLPEEENLDSSGSELDVMYVEALNASIKSSLSRENICKTLPQIENVKDGDFYAIYWDKSHYWAKVIDVIRDAGGKPSKLEVSSLCRKVLSSDTTKVRWAWPIIEDKAQVNVNMLLLGPETPIKDTNIKGKTWYYFKAEGSARNTYYTIKQYGFPSPRKRKQNALI